MRRPARSASDAIGAPSGTATASRQRAEAELEQRLDLDAGLDDLVLAGDAEVDVARRRPHRDVVGAREQELEVEVVGSARAACGRSSSNWMPASRSSRVGAAPPGGPWRAARAAAGRGAVTCALRREAVEHEAVAALAVAQPVRDARHGRRRAADALGHLGVGHALVDAAARRPGGAPWPGSRRACRGRAGTPPLLVARSRPNARTGRRRSRRAIRDVLVHRVELITSGMLAW